MEDLDSIWAPSFDLLYVLSYCYVSHATSETQEAKEQIWGEIMMTTEEKKSSWSLYVLPGKKHCFERAENQGADKLF